MQINTFPIKSKLVFHNNIRLETAQVQQPMHAYESMRGKEFLEMLYNITFPRVSWDL